jgi:NAD(P)-dependent dehydrogenase (short-subunit alcohol dehydrogenase family)
MITIDCGVSPSCSKTQPDEIAEPIAFLAGPRSNYTRGSELYVDRGWTAQ